MDRFRGGEPRADPGIPGRQQRGAVGRRTGARKYTGGGTDTGATPVRQSEAAWQGFGSELHHPNDGAEPGAGDAANPGLSRDRAGESDVLTTDQVHHALHRAADVARAGWRRVAS